MLFEIISSNILNYNNNKNATSYQQLLFFHKLLHKSSQLTFRGSAQSYNPLLSPHYVLFLPPPPPQSNTHTPHRSFMASCDVSNSCRPYELRMLEQFLQAIQFLIELNSYISFKLSFHPFRLILM